MSGSLNAFGSQIVYFMFHDTQMHTKYYYQYQKCFSIGILVLIRSRYVLAIVLINTFLVTCVEPIKVGEAEVEGGQRWVELW